ncbi:urease accessory UreF family protein [uncultured Endozoicomonas sp.]|uniref:urease accessory protein UreF n=1 Tax=uncultured Endozoicomonas sp. TaxID=432652 RepID=UPI00260856DF|nr:urease accessory UreF family protein [uncultured Endozoicomonas sp.]
MSITTESLLGLLHLSSPALPVGAFAYSQGLETAIDRQWCHNRQTTGDWISELMLQGMAKLDVPVFLRLYRALKNHDQEQVIFWNDTLLAFRETKELYDEDCQVGRAFCTWVKSMYPDEPRADWLITPTQCSMFSLSSLLGSIDEQSAVIGLLWSWCENQVTAATKAVPLGQTDAQHILKRLTHEMDGALNAAHSLNDHEIGNNMMHYTMASSWHEHQYSRLFRS